jgi:hypothetical protein
LPHCYSWVDQRAQLVENCGLNDATLIQARGHLIKIDGCSGGREGGREGREGREEPNKKVMGRDSVCRWSLLVSHKTGKGYQIPGGIMTMCHMHM